MVIGKLLMVEHIQKIYQLLYVHILQIVILMKIRETNKLFSY